MERYGREEAKARTRETGRIRPGHLGQSQQPGPVWQPEGREGEAGGQEAADISIDLVI